jgi:hypothetical protein
MGMDEYAEELAALQQKFGSGWRITITAGGMCDAVRVPHPYKVLSAPTALRSASSSSSAASAAHSRSGRLAGHVIAKHPRRSLPSPCHARAHAGVPHAQHGWPQARGPWPADAGHLGCRRGRDLMARTPASTSCAAARPQAQLGPRAATCAAGSVPAGPATATHALTSPVPSSPGNFSPKSSSLPPRMILIPREARSVGSSSSGSGDDAPTISCVPMREPPGVLRPPASAARLRATDGWSDASGSPRWRSLDLALYALLCGSGFGAAV